MDTRGQRQIAADMGLGMHLPVTSGHLMEYLMTIWQVATEGWLRLVTEQARLSPACRW